MSEKTAAKTEKHEAPKAETPGLPKPPVEEAPKAPPAKQPASPAGICPHCTNNIYFTGKEKAGVPVQVQVKCGTCDYVGHMIKA